MNMNKMRCTCGEVHWEINPYVKPRNGQKLPGGRKLKKTRLLKKRMRWEHQLHIQPRQIQCAIDWTIKYATDARWDIVGQAMKIMETECVKKISDERWSPLVLGYRGPEWDKAVKEELQKFRYI
jgi:hypothetical protein